VKLIAYTSGLWPCGVAAYHRNLAAALAASADVTTVPLSAERTFGRDLRALRQRRRETVALAARSAGFDAALIDYTDTFFNGVRRGEALFPLFARSLKCPAIVLLHENHGRTDAADVEGPLPTKLLQRLTHDAFALRDTGAATTTDYERYLRTRLFSGAAHLVTHSPTLVAARPHDLPPERTHLLPTPAYPLPLPSLTRADVDAKHGLAGKRVLVLFGLPQPSKGFDLAVAALPHLPGDVVVLQVGHAPRCAEAAAALLAQAESLGVAGRFVRAGAVPDPELHALLLRADAGLAPFRTVHQSSSVGHLLAVGLPVVASKAPALEALAADGAGLLFADVADPPAFAAAVETALTAGDALRVRSATYATTHTFRATADRLLAMIRGR
jgi:glycosyltransferase involved in cell wall biosynthesis